MSRRGFTLLEVLLALGLAVLLLACLWSVFGVFNRFFETAPGQAEQAQLLSALAAQIAEDLQCAIEDSPPPDPPAATAAGPRRLPAAGARANSGSVRRFGLMGTSTSLRIDVLQPVPPERLAAAAGAFVAAGGDLGPRVPELHTVYYDFISPVPEDDMFAAITGEVAALEDEFAEPPGLVRSEIDFETPVEAASGAAAGPLSAVGDPRAANFAGGPSAAAANLPAPPLSQAVMLVPEIAGLQFRYFDGRIWNGSWNSLQRKSLPVAVEIRLQVKPPASMYPTGPAEAETSSPAGVDDWEAELLGMEGIVEPALPWYRFVVYLPGARMRPAVQYADALFPWEMPAWPPPDRGAAAQTAAPPQAPAAAAAVPLPEPIAPQSVPPARNRGFAPVARPDQWMRSGT